MIGVAGVSEGESMSWAECVDEVSSVVKPGAE